MIDHLFVNIDQRLKTEHQRVQTKLVLFWRLEYCSLGIYEYFYIL